MPVFLDDFPACESYVLQRPNYIEQYNIDSEAAYGEDVEMLEEDNEEKIEK